MTAKSGLSPKQIDCKWKNASVAIPHRPHHTPITKMLATGRTGARRCGSDSMNTPGSSPANTKRFRNAATQPLSTCHRINGSNAAATPGTR